eukprot:7946581-Pyramimonas_sp.AAC.1
MVSAAAIPDATSTSTSNSGALLPAEVGSVCSVSQSSQSDRQTDRQTVTDRSSILRRRGVLERAVEGV